MINLKKKAYLNIRKTLLKKYNNKNYDSKTRSELKKYINEFTPLRTRFSMKIFSTIFNKIINKLFSKVTVLGKQNIEALEKIDNQNNCLVFTPSHKSNIDYLLLGAMLNNYNFELPAAAANKTLNFWPLGYFLKKCGAYFVRQKRQKSLYFDILKDFFSLCFDIGTNHILYLEGGLSKDGHFGNVHSGGLRMLIDRLYQKPNIDLVFMPINVIYEFVPEDKYLAKSLLGKYQLHTNFKTFLTLPKFIQDYGELTVKYGQPIKLKDFYSKEKYQNLSEVEKRQAVKDISLKVMNEIKSLTLLTAPMVIAHLFATADSKEISQNTLIETCQKTTPQLTLEKIIWALKKFVKNKILNINQDIYSINEENKHVLTYYHNQYLDNSPAGVNYY